MFLSLAMGHLSTAHPVAVHVSALTPTKGTELLRSWAQLQQPGHFS